MDSLEEFTNKQGFKFRVPTFCHVPLNMHRVFASVQQRGGYNIVTENKVSFSSEKQVSGFQATGQMEPVTKLKVTIVFCHQSDSFHNSVLHDRVMSMSSEVLQGPLRVAPLLLYATTNYMGALLVATIF